MTDTQPMFSDENKYASEAEFCDFIFSVIKAETTPAVLRACYEAFVVERKAVIALLEAQDASGESSPEYGKALDVYVPLSNVLLTKVADVFEDASMLSPTGLAED